MVNVRAVQSIYFWPDFNIFRTKWKRQKFLANFPKFLDLNFTQQFTLFQVINQNVALYVSNCEFAQLENYRTFKSVDEGSCFIQSINIQTHWTIYFKKLFIYFQRQGKGGRKRGENHSCERNINQLSIICALTRDRTHNLLLSGMPPNPLSHTGQGLDQILIQEKSYLKANMLKDFFLRAWYMCCSSGKSQIQVFIKALAQFKDHCFVSILTGQKLKLQMVNTCRGH